MLVWEKLIKYNIRNRLPDSSNTGTKQIWSLIYASSYQKSSVRSTFNCQLIFASIFFTDEELSSCLTWWILKISVQLEDNILQANAISVGMILLRLYELIINVNTWKSLNPFCFLSNLPPLCHFSPYSPPPRMFGIAR